MSDNKILVGDMSRKQCLEVLKRLLEAMETFDGISPSPERINALKMAISSLETDEAYQLEYESTTKNDISNKSIIYKAKESKEIQKDLDKLSELNKTTTKNDLGVDCISRQSVLDKVQRLIDAEQNNIDENGDYMNYARERVNAYEAIQFFVENDCLCPSVIPQTPKCKDCKWWKDSDGKYRRGCGAESKCPINRREVFECRLMI